MASMAAKKVAQEVLETIGKGKRPSVRQIAPKYGYSPLTAGSGQIQQTETFKSVINPFVEKMERERDRLIKALSEKDLTKEKYRDLMEGVDKLTKNIQLLNGGETDRAGLIIKFDVPFNPTSETK